MTDLTITLGTKEIDDLVKKFPRLNQIVFDEMERGMAEILEMFKGEVASRTPVNFGTLRQSIQPIVRGSAPSFEGELSTPLLYGEVVERGRAAGSQPPTAPIELWVQRKLGLTGDEARSAAYLIARSIGGREIKGKFMFKKGFEAGKPAMGRLWSNVPKRAVKKIEGSV